MSEILSAEWHTYLVEVHIQGCVVVDHAQWKLVAKSVSANDWQVAFYHHLLAPQVFLAKCPVPLLSAINKQYNSLH